MGIPSFYRQLCRRYPQLISKSVQAAACEWLCLDFNCAMYHVLRSMKPFATAASPAQWETEFCEAISEYLETIISVSRPTRGVFVSCDGVVCAAKRRQQRLRRFKGPWLSVAEKTVRRQAGGVVSDVPSWDQNALTPGSAFMATLGSHLETSGRRLQKQLGVPVVVSTTAEPGEGEHKLLQHIRSVRPASCTIYGLDADLILLSMLAKADTGTQMTLLREAQEFESKGRREEARGWRLLHVRGLADAMGLTTDVRIRDFVACMSLLGNDFLPRSLTRTVRDDGIGQLLAGLQSLWSSGRTVVGLSGLQRDSLLTLLEPWAANEEEDMRVATNQAFREAMRPPPLGSSPEETAVLQWNALPASWGSVLRILRPDRQLRADWRHVYRERWAAGSADDYVRGLAWVWNYYSGKPVDLGWMYDAHLPPLWSEIVAALRRAPESLLPPPLQWPEPLPEWVHLLSVLPVDSVRRLLPPSKHKLMEQSPWFWPSSWTLFDVGRGQMWECEPVLPIPSEAVLRAWAAKS
jgi:5'-3' exonuclease